MSGPLSDAELERLAERLAANLNAAGLSLEGVDGLFCALIASPSMIGPSAYLPVILGGEPQDSAGFADEADANDTLSLLIRYWNQIAHDFSHERVHLPYIEEPGTDGILGRDWARGYLRGTRLAPDGWVRLFQDEGEGLALTIPVVAGEVDPHWPLQPQTEAQREETLNMMIASAGRAYRYFETDRRALADTARAAASPFERDAPKIGRNEPCPCGSGKKFKKCCGAPGGA